MADNHTTEEVENIQSAFVAGAMWAAADLAFADDEAITLFERASAVAREDYEPGDHEAEDERWLAGRLTRRRVIDRPNSSPRPTLFEKQPVQQRCSARRIAVLCGFSQPR